MDKQCGDCGDPIELMYQEWCFICWIKNLNLNRLGLQITGVQNPGSLQIC